MSLKTLNYKFQTPNYDEFELQFYISNIYDATVKDLKREVFYSGKYPVSPTRLRFILNKREMFDDEKLVDIHLVGSVIEIVVKVVDADALRQFFTYDEFVRSIQPPEGSINVPVDESVCVQFGPNAYSHIVFVPALISAASDLRCPYHGDMIQYFEGNLSQASKYGYSQWTAGAQWPAERVLLLEVDESLELRLHSLRYSADSPLNYDYDRGDNNSWQRYTHSPPVQCVLSTTFHKDEPLCTVTIRPCLPLKRNTHYAVLLCNNVPTIPLGLQDSELLQFLPMGLGEDRLFLFRTQK